MSRRDEAVEHAADLLREGGPDALTSVAVAARLGLTQSAVYRHIRDMDELSALAAEVVVAELVASLHDILLDPTIDWERLDDIDRLCGVLVASMVANSRSFTVVDRWRFVDGPLGIGIRRVIQDGIELIGSVLEMRWRAEFGGDGAVIGSVGRTAIEAHAVALHDDGHAIARLVREPNSRLGPAAVAQVLRNRMIAGWSAFVIDMNDLHGLAFPAIVLEDARPRPERTSSSVSR